MEVCLPGTGGVIPLENRWLTCCWVEHQGKALLIDCGEGTQVALKKAGCKLSRLNTLLITHFHADHTAGLPGLLLTLGNSGKTTPLTIIGPMGLHLVVAALTVIAPVLPYPLYLLELEADKPGKLDADAMEIRCLPLKHGIPCFGYRVSVKRKPIFNPQKAKQLGVPVTLYHALHAGQTVTLPDGRMVKPEMVLDGERASLSICYCTDTQPTDGLTEFARNADLLVCEGMYGDESMRGKVEEKGHMLFSDSARIARDSGAKRLWLTHFSPALTAPEQYLDEARSIFPQAEVAYDGIRITLGQKIK